MGSPLNEADATKLRKLMQLSQSENDNEALSALRKANSLLKNHEMNWDDFFKLIRPAAISIEEWQKKQSDSFYRAFGIRPFPMGGMTSWNKKHNF